jgi:EAL domain-containing protein (putative c-di-GMP-specific phosphodiesterase class I)
VTNSVAVLAIHVSERSRLTDIFGPEAVGQALADFGQALEALSARLLAQHEVIDRRRRDGDGRWSVCFRVRAGGLPRDTRETCAAIEGAGRKLVHDLLIAIFGGATGRRIPIHLTVFPLSAEASLRALERPPVWSEENPLAPPRQVFRNPAISVDDVSAVLAGRSVRTLLQPIVRMSDRAVVGYEALSRGPPGSPLEQPDALFDAAHAFDRSVAMELLCAELALERTRGRLPAGTFLTINLGPGALVRAAGELPLEGRRAVMFELTEHLPLGEAEGLRGAVERLRARGIGLALDDTGCGFADLDTVRVLKPEVVKLCITVIRNARRGSPCARAICATSEQLVALGCRVLAEGVETREQHTALGDCPIELAQGWFYGRPQPVEVVVG